MQCQAHTKIKTKQRRKAVYIFFTLAAFFSFKICFEVKFVLKFEYC